MRKGKKEMSYGMLRTYNLGSRLNKNKSTTNFGSKSLLEKKLSQTAGKSTNSKQNSNPSNQEEDIRLRMLKKKALKMKKKMGGKNINKKPTQNSKILYTG